MNRKDRGKHMDIKKLWTNLRKDIVEKKADKLALKEKEIYHKRIIKEEKENKKKDKIAPEGAFISLVDVNKIYPNHVQAVYDFNLNIKQHEFIVLVGPSGCGKSTTLRMIAGLESITSGDLFIDGLYANELPPKDRDIAMVFQSYALYPHMTVYENMAFGLKVNHVKKEEIDKRVIEAAKILQITDYLNRKPSALSGGQMQRVALGRAIVRNSKVFLMDEPLSNLDAKLRVQMRSEIVRLHKVLNATTIYVTHDQTEAMTMATRIVVMNKGHIQQIGTPSEIYNRPVNIFVATFIGSPAMNILPSILDGSRLSIDGTFAIDLKPDISEIVKKFYEEQRKLVEGEIANKKDSLYATFKDAKSFKHLKNSAVSSTNNSNLSDSIVKIKAEAARYINSLEKGFLDDGFAKYTEGTLKSIESVDEIKESFAKIDAIYESYLKEYIFAVSVSKNEELASLLEQDKKLETIDLKKPFNLVFGIRPEDMHDAISHENKLKYEESDMKVSVAELLGHEYYLHFDVPSGELVSKNTAARVLDTGDIVKLFFNKEKIHLFDPITQKRIY
jgi:multiple sugar transport system ATP-binding protein